MTETQLRDVAVCARTQAWCVGLQWDVLQDFAPEDKQWEHDRDAFVNTALVILGHRGVTFADIRDELAKAWP